MAQLRTTHVATRGGSSIAVQEAGDGAPCVFAVGGMTVRSFADSGVRLAFEDAADKGARCMMMDIAGSGASTRPANLTMQAWLDDVEEVFAHRVGEPAIWTGASIGAWLMVLAHRRHPEWFLSMCALAPAFDWDQQYVAPRILDGTLGMIGGTLVQPDRTALATRDLVVSMAPHHLLREPVRLTAPLHVIFGARDELAPAGPITRFIERATGARCSGELLPEGDHGVAKLDPPVALLRYQAWLHSQLAHAASGPPRERADPGSAR